MFERKYDPQLDTRQPVRHKRKTIPSQSERGDKSTSAYFIEALETVKLFEVMVIKHDMPHKLAVAFVNRAGNTLYRRFKTVQTWPGEIACWRFE